MSENFWAGYISGVAGIILGNPWDLVKVRLQAQSLLAEPTLSRQQTLNLLIHPTKISGTSLSPSSVSKYFRARSFVTGIAAPIISYGGLNAVLFVAYHETENALNRALLTSASPRAIIPISNGGGGSTVGSNLWTTWLAGAVGGLAIWLISAPTELIKCRAQLASNQAHPPPSSSTTTTPSSSYHIAQTILRDGGIRGLYHGGVVTALRDSIGYGFYFWSYELGKRIMTSFLTQQPGSAWPSVNANGIDGKGGGASPTGFFTQETAKVLLCGGVAGVVSWASIYPLDVIKTRVQGQAYPTAALNPAATPLLGTNIPRRKGAMQTTKEAYREGGVRVFFRGLPICSLRAFYVNAVQWIVYEQVMLYFGQPNRDKQNASNYS
ncbi:mitochondrial carrier [Nemania diffusa]|nr:mitochondrial carrier [Nemania diffusa]